MGSEIGKALYSSQGLTSSYLTCMNESCLILLKVNIFGADKNSPPGAEPTVNHLVSVDEFILTNIFPSNLTNLIACVKKKVFLAVRTAGASQ